MATLDQIQNRVLAFRGQEMEVARKAIMENLDIAADLVATQLAQGLKKDGSKADFTYAPLTIAIKRTRSGLSSVTDHLTNYDTGESYRNLYAKVSGYLVEFGTKTDKDEAISERMDREAFGLTPDSGEEWIRQHVQGAFNQMVRAVLQL